MILEAFSIRDIRGRKLCFFVKPEGSRSNKKEADLGQPLLY
jgi:hypothetical protein